LDSRAKLNGTSDNPLQPGAKDHPDNATNATRGLQGDQGDDKKEQGKQVVDNNAEDDEDDEDGDEDDDKKGGERLKTNGKRNLCGSGEEGDTSDSPTHLSKRSKPNASLPASLPDGTFPAPNPCDACLQHIKPCIVKASGIACNPCHAKKIKCSLATSRSRTKTTVVRPHFLNNLENDASSFDSFSLRGQAPQLAIKTLTGEMR
jgi:hypothetical protein